MKWYSCNGARKNVLGSKEMRDKKELVGNFFPHMMLISMDNTRACVCVCVCEQRKRDDEIEAKGFFKTNSIYR